ncbi:MAG: inositol monophosphatase family protein [Planctomycetota bacterium]
MNDPTDRLAFAVEITREAGQHTLELFGRHDLFVDRKGDGTPVTEADRGAEQLLRARIGERFPNDSILGEEFDDKEGDSDYRWVLDPIDGTKSFIYGIPLYTTLVAVLKKNNADLGDPQAGVILAPATGEMAYAGIGTGCWAQRGDGEPRQVSVSKNEALSDSLIVTSDAGSFAADRNPGAGDVYQWYQKECRLARTWGDGYGLMMVATGRAEAMVDPIVSLWDVAPAKPIVEEAGGRFTDWQGNPTVHGGDAIATNGLLHEAILERTRGR